jgi:hypothetical protein
VREGCSAFASWRSNEPRSAGAGTRAAAAPFIGAQTEKLDFPMLGKIRDEGFSRSQVMDHVSWLSDVYAPRLTGSPAIQQASEWAMKTFNEWSTRASP